MDTNMTKNCERLELLTLIHISLFAYTDFRMLQKTIDIHHKKLIQ